MNFPVKPLANPATNQVFKTADHARHPYLIRIDPALLEQLNDQEQAAVQKLLSAIAPQPAPKLVNLRFTIDLVITRFYLVLLVGKDRRKSTRPKPAKRLTRILDGMVALFLLLGLNISISAFMVLTLYLIKSALGIDLFAFHLKDLVATF